MHNTVTMPSRAIQGNAANPIVNDTKILKPINQLKFLLAVTHARKLELAAYDEAIH